VVRKRRENNFSSILSYSILLFISIVKSCAVVLAHRIKVLHRDLKKKKKIPLTFDREMCTLLFEQV
jgi:hypothetical protein